MRLDVWLVQQDYYPSREKARHAIESGDITVDGKPVIKPSMHIEDGQRVHIIGNHSPFVSRGGIKLAHGIQSFGLTLEGVVALDVGASTGGFTDCMLQHGAQRIYAIDVGHNQMQPQLANDPRVVCMEGINAKKLAALSFDPAPSFAAIDVSFISLRLVIEPVMACLPQDAHIVALIKPQFEVLKTNRSSGGIVKNPKVHITVLERLCQYFMEAGSSICGLLPSPIRGGEGNIEFLIHLRKAAPGQANDWLQDGQIPKTVQEAHRIV